MNNIRQAKLLRIYLLEHERLHGKPLYHAIVSQAKKLGLRGATVLRGICGFSQHSPMTSIGIADLAANLPLVVEIVEHEDKLSLLIPFIDEHLQDGLVTIEDISILRAYPADRQGN